MVSATHPNQVNDLVPQQKLVDGPTAARILAVGHRTVVKLVRKGELHPIKIGRLTRFSLPELDRFIAARQTATTKGGQN